MEKNEARTEAIWNAMACSYEAFTDRPDSYSERIEVPCIEALLPPLEGCRVLDLGCGTGRFTRLLAERGAAEVIGLDLSPTMLALAETKLPAGGSIRFVHGSVLELGFLEGASIDVVFSSTTLHYVENLDEALAGVARVLRVEGKAILSVMHPVYTSSYPVAGEGDEWKPRYLDRRLRRYRQSWSLRAAEGEQVLCESVHHTFSDYARAILAAGLRLTGLFEPGPPEAWRTADPERWRATWEEPLYAVFVCEKPA